MKLPGLINYVGKKLPLSLKNRLWLMEGGLVGILITGIIILIFSADIPNILNSEPYDNIRRGLDDQASILMQRYSLMFVNAIDLANKVNTAIDTGLNKKGLSARDIKSHPEIIEELLENEVEISINSMQRAGCSGVYLILDATVNPALTDSNNSKAGIYIKDINANIFSFQNNKYYLFRGSSKIAREYEMYLDSKWELEYNISSSLKNSDGNLFVKPFMAALSNKNEDLRNLGYWSTSDYIGQETEKFITFSVPLIDKDGTAYGVCGLEMSEYFLQSYMNNGRDKSFTSLSYIFSNEQDGYINLQKSVFLGGVPISILSGSSNYLKPSTPDKNNAFQYFLPDTNNRSKIIGITQVMNIYPEDSLFKNDKWCLVAFLHPDDISNTRFIYLGLNIFILLIIGVVISYFISRYYTGRITKTFKQIMEQPNQIDITNIPEIDDLVEFLRKEYMTSEEHKENENSEAAEKEQYSKFLERVNSLSRTEKEIFDLYINGFNAKQICELRFVSMNTIKTHNRNIYKKLNVRSRIELLENFNKLRKEKNPD